MQDNATVHTARIIQEWLVPWAAENGVQLLDWPPYSPDLNPEENQWKLVKDKIANDHDYLQELPNTRPSLNFVKTATMDEWWEIERRVLNHLVDSMPRRLQAVIDNNGWYTKY